MNVPPTMLFDSALRGASVALLLLLAGVFTRDRRDAVIARIGIVFALSLVVQVVSSAPAFEASVPRLWQAPFVGVSVANGVLFWLFASALFDDDFTPSPWHALIWLAVAGLAARNCAVGWQADSAAGRLAIGAQRAALAVFVSASTWRRDLIEKRRRLRSLIVAAGTCYTVGMIVVRFASSDARLGAGGAIVDAAAIVLLTAVVAGGTLRVAGTPLIPPAPAVPTSGAPDPRLPPQRADPADERLADALGRLMRDERPHRVEGLTLSGLADRMRVPEYRLRRVINRHLGHRNFNAFVNGYRLGDARIALADPAQDATPVLTIALTAGFQSIGPFNRAFKADTGLTPTEFRRRHRTD